MSTEPVSFTPEDVEKAEYEILMNQVHKAISTGEPLTLSTTGKNAEAIMAMYRKIELFDREYPISSLEPITTKCPLCGEPSPENKTCMTCLGKYIAESKEWLKKNER